MKQENSGEYVWVFTSFVMILSGYSLELLKDIGMFAKVDTCDLLGLTCCLELGCFLTFFASVCSTDRRQQSKRWRETNIGGKISNCQAYVRGPAMCNIVAALPWKFVSYCICYFFVTPEAFLGNGKLPCPANEKCFEDFLVNAKCCHVCIIAALAIGTAVINGMMKHEYEKFLQHKDNRPDQQSSQEENQSRKASYLFFDFRCKWVNSRKFADQAEEREDLQENFGTQAVSQCQRSVGVQVSSIPSMNQKHTYIQKTEALLSIVTKILEGDYKEIVGLIREHKQLLALHSESESGSGSGTLSERQDEVDEQPAVNGFLADNTKDHHQELGATIEQSQSTATELNCMILVSKAASTKKFYRQQKGGEPDVPENFRINSYRSDHHYDDLTGSLKHFENQDPIPLSSSMDEYDSDSRSEEQKQQQRIVKKYHYEFDEFDLIDFAQRN